MPPDNRGRTKTKSKLSLSKRRERAYLLFSRGYTDTDVAKDLHVNKDTVRKYRARYNESIHTQAAANPRFLQDVVANTMRSLTELDQIRADAWKHMEPRTEKIEFECPHCEEVTVIKQKIEPSDDTRSKYMSHLLKAQEMRAKLLGVLGIKTDVFIAVMQVKVVADHLMRFMAEELCAEDRAKLEEFLMMPEIAEYVGAQNANVLDAIDVEAVEGAEA
jgi:DNA-binding CsgD family transcriptional regulator